MNLFNKNTPTNWNNHEILKYLDEFIELYKERPVKDNSGGMKFPHMFGLFFLLKSLKPDFVVESGIYKGQSTWLIEKTLPNVDLLCLDPNLNYRKYISESNKVKYSNLDFTAQDFSNIPKNSLVFFDDHQNFYDRLVYSNFFGFKHVIGEDNYPASQGDTYSFKKIFSGTGLNDRRASLKKLIKSFFILSKYTLSKIIDKNYINVIQKYDLSIQDIEKSENHFKNLEKIIETYFEFPPIFKTKYTRWGDLWDEKNYPTKKALLTDEYIKDYEDIYQESNSYNWMCYLKIKD
jgi:hypothetical protein|tara:strand:- start:72 stop:944 length:873 start_codon:yes stop_codon:yes gene_type:complete